MRGEEARDSFAMPSIVGLCIRERRQEKVCKEMNGERHKEVCVLLSIMKENVLEYVSVSLRVCL